MFYIEQKYGNDGFAVWVKLLRALATTNYHYLNLGNEEDLMFLASKCRVSEAVLIQVLNDLSKFNEIDREIWEKYKHVWSDKFIDSIADAYGKRRNKLLKKEELLQQLTGNFVKNDDKVSVNPLNSTVNPHSIVYNNKENNTIQNNSKEKDMQNRKLSFSESLKKYIPEYNREMLLDFYYYWVETNKSKTKMKWELQKTWDLNLRLKKWLSNDKKFNNGKTGKGTTNSNNAAASRNELASLADGILRSNNGKLPG